MPDLTTIKQVAEIFTGLKTLNLDENAEVVMVNGLRVVEVVRDLCEIKFEENVLIDSSLSFWYLKESETQWPLIAEFSFTYKAVTGAGGLEDFPEKTIQGANRFFSALQKHDGWLDLSGTTKTAFALDA